MSNSIKPLFRSAHIAAPRFFQNSETNYILQFLVDTHVDYHLNGCHPIFPINKISKEWGGSNKELIKGLKQLHQCGFIKLAGDYIIVNIDYYCSIGEFMYERFSDEVSYDKRNRQDLMQVRKAIRKKDTATLKALGYKEDLDATERFYKYIKSINKKSPETFILFGKPLFDSQESLQRLYNRYLVFEQ